MSRTAARDAAVLADLRSGAKPAFPYKIAERLPEHSIGMISASLQRLRIAGLASHDGPGGWHALDAAPATLVQDTLL